MKQPKYMRVWNILYPIGMYYVITVTVLLILDYIIPETADSKLLRQLITSVAVLPFLYSYYQQDTGKTKKLWNLWPKGILKKLMGAFVFGGCFAIAFNTILGMLRLADYSASYRQVAETFYTGRLLLEIIALCIVIPLAEELLYRGIVYERLRGWLGMRASVLGSAFIFGLVHMNLAQFVYAFIFGILLACLAEWTEGFFAATAAHMAANLTSVLRAETNIFAFLDQSVVVRILAVIILFTIAGLTFAWTRRSPEDRN